MGGLEFDDLFRESFSSLVSLGVSMTGDVEVSRDLAQETMIRAHRRWDEVAGYDHPKAWLRRVMSNLLIDHHRSRTSERGAVQRVAAHLPDPARDEDPLEQSPRSAAERWNALLAPLSPLQRAVATLFYAEDQSVARIAETLEISEGTVKSTLSKVRDRLRTALEHEEEEDEDDEGEEKA